ncbi:hypothetical protein IFM89_037816 [Coptis chinensis]|uniref:Uncharacterized protein n=1 Tax=Coptis chinensis TaxID=261450 RepID=A0A835HBQ3_9MAGN|nr:hypothetical protein IFM89_037816 [Coptis chinensis]
MLSRTSSMNVPKAWEWSQENFGKQQLMSLECTTQFQNGIHLPLGMGSEQQAQSISWLPNNDSQHLMLTEDQSLLHQRNTCLRLQLGGQYHYPPYGLNFLLDKNMKPDGKMNMQGPPLDHQVGESARYGVDINTGGIIDTFANFVWEPAVVKINAINAATEAACLILSVDETVKNPKVSRRVHKEMLLLERWVEGVAGQVSVAVEGECDGVELLGFEDAKDFLE